MYSDPNIPCAEKLRSVYCTHDPECRSALQNMYGCDDMNTCPTSEIPYAGGLAWTSAGSRAIQCNCGQNAHCHNPTGRGGHCDMGRRQSYEEYGVMESPDVLALTHG